MSLGRPNKKRSIPKVNRIKSKTNQEFDALFDEIEKSLENVTKSVEAVREEKTLMFAQVESTIESQIQADNAEPYEAALGVARTALIDQLRESMKRWFARLRDDVRRHFKLDNKAARAKLKFFTKLPRSLVEEYVEAKSISLVDTKAEHRAGDYHGQLKWNDNLNSFKCIKYFDALGFRETGGPRNYFWFRGQKVRVRHDPARLSKIGKHSYLFEILAKDEQVQAAFPVELAYDIFTTPTAFYTYGPHLLVVTNFYKIYTQPLFNVLKKLDVNRELPEKKPKGYYNACCFALFDRNFRLLNVLLTSEDRNVGAYNFSIELLNEQGFVISKKFSYVSSGEHMIVDAKKLVTFYDYKFTPIFEDFELPGSEKYAYVVRVVGEQLYLANLICADEEHLKFTVLNMDDGSIVKSSFIAGKKRRFMSVSKIMMDSTDNLIMVMCPNVPRFAWAFMSELIISCVNVDAGQWHECNLRCNGAFYRGSNVNDKDELVVFCQENTTNGPLSITFRI